MAQESTANGLAGTLDEAKVEFEKGWQKWLASEPGKANC
jgi:hypothetical protein